MKTQDFRYVEVDGDMYVGKDDGLCNQHGWMEPVKKRAHSMVFECPDCHRSVTFEKCVDLSNV